MFNGKTLSINCVVCIVRGRKMETICARISFWKSFDLFESMCDFFWCVFHLLWDESVHVQIWSVRKFLYDRFFYFRRDKNKLDRCTFFLKSPFSCKWQSVSPQLTAIASDAKETYIPLFRTPRYSLLIRRHFAEFVCIHRCIFRWKNNTQHCLIVVLLCFIEASQWPGGSKVGSCPWQWYAFFPLPFSY